MSRRPITRAVAFAVTALLVLASPLPADAAPPSSTEPNAAERPGLQSVAKDLAAAAGAQGALVSDKGVNPYIGLLPDVSRTDYAYWRAAMEEAGKQRAAAQAARDEADVAAGRVPRPFLVDEEEAVRGGNDSPATAQYIPRFGSADSKRPAARILGTLLEGPPPSGFAPIPEDNGAIPLAGDTGLQAGRRRLTYGDIGDGPHGSQGSGSGDFDHYRLSAQAGQQLLVDIDSGSSDLDSVLVLYNAAGALIALNDDDGSSFDSLLRFTIPSDGDYFVAVEGFGGIQEDPFDSASGFGAGSEGSYAITFGLDADDVDFYAVDLRAGDVLGASVTGAAGVLAPHDPAGRPRGGSTFDASFIYPTDSPLPGGGNAVFAHVADKTGRHTIEVASGTGAYDVTLEVYRPGPESIDRNKVQRIFLDFDGARVNTGIFGGPGVRQLSPLRAFLGRWGLTAASENALINRIVRTTTENLERDFEARGVAVEILNSRDHRDPFGQPNVSRIIVGGTIAQSGIETIGIAQSIDPGNYELEETALVLLDILSDPPDPDDETDPSLNAYLGPQSDRVRFVGTAVGNVVSHEAGHYLGSFHVDQFNDILNLMDQGGNFPLLYGVGPDGVGGTSDDPDVDFGEDVYNPFEGFTGIEDTAANTRWGLSARR